MQPWMIYSIIGVVTFAYFFVGYQLYQKIIHMNPKADYHVVNQEDPFFQPSWQWYQTVPKEDVTIRAYDQTVLHATFIPSIDKNSTLLAMIFHGYHSNSEDLALIAKMYSDWGFKILLVDQRGHGKSQGTFTSFGVYEKYDLRKWINYCLRIYGYNDTILLHGVSMGAATIIQAAGLGLPENVKLLVCDSPFSTILKTLRKTMKPKLLLLFFPALHFFTYTQHRFFLSQAHSLKAAAKNAIPTVFVHGDQDQITPLSMMKQLVLAMSKVATFPYIVKNAPHGEGFIYDKPGLEAMLMERLIQYFNFKRPKPKK